MFLLVRRTEFVVVPMTTQSYSILFGSKLQAFFPLIRAWVWE